MLNGRLALTTPEGIRLHLTPAGPIARAWAWAIDLAVWGAIAFVLAMVLSGSKTGVGIMSVLAFLSYWGYPILFEVYGKGQTLGKRMMHIRVVREDGLPVGWRESCLRNLLLVADFLPLMYVSGLICMLFDTRFRRLGDLVAATQVVYVDKPVPRSKAPQATPLPLPFALTPEQQRALADLFERESTLPQARLAELGTIAEALTGCQGLDSLETMRSYVAGIMQ
jgi:uncharacterized RDD family membrane protein YckC